MGTQPSSCRSKYYRYLGAGFVTIGDIGPTRYYRRKTASITDIKTFCRNISLRHHILNHC